MSLSDFIVNTLEKEKAEDVISIDLRGKSEIADCMIIASGRSNRQVTALAQKLGDRLKQDLGLTCRLEGKEHGDWVLLDCGDAVIHLFKPEVREFYQLEKMWLGERPKG